MLKKKSITLTLSLYMHIYVYICNNFNYFESIFLINLKVKRDFFSEKMSLKQGVK